MTNKNKDYIAKDLSCRINGSTLRIMKINTDKKVLDMKVFDLIKDIEADTLNKYKLVREFKQGMDIIANDASVYKTDLLRGLKAIYTSMVNKTDQTLKEVLTKQPLSELVANTPYFGVIGAVAIYKFLEFTGIKIEI